MSGSNPGPIALDWDKMVVVGHVARAHGNRGQVIVNPQTDFPETRFREGAVLCARVGHDTREVRITDVRFQGGRPVIALDGVATMDGAESLAGAELRVPEAALPTLPSGTHYQHELVGCVVTTVAGGHVGTVAEIQGPPGAQRLIVRAAGATDTGIEIDVPFAEAICVRVDTTRRSILIDPPEGLLELNRTG